VCQEVCPWNRFAPTVLDRALWPSPGINPAELAPLFFLDDAAFRERFRATPLWRARRRGLLRNAAIVLGNHPYPAAVRALIRGLNDVEPVVRGACAWALGRHADPAAHAALRARLMSEDEPEVRAEIEASLEPSRPLAPRVEHVSRSETPTLGSPADGLEVEG
jgi:epoxyqueuosine reductase